jgi:hypothetical protein
MEILSKRIYEILKDKGVTSIYHANSVMSACSFLQNRCLLSRGSMDKSGLLQTSQISAKTGRNYGIWDDVFTDSVDIHRLAGSANTQGPVLFELDVEIIRQTYTGKVWVTKSNPAEWETLTHHERRWFVSAVDLDHYFARDNADHMTVFRHCGGKLPIHNHLKKIVLDDPELKTQTDQIDCFSMAYGAIRLAMSDGGFDVPVEKRVCDAACGCRDDYLNCSVDAERMFSPHQLQQ